MILLTLWAVAALVLECTASLPPGRPPRLNKVGFDSTKLVECAEQPKTQKINAGQTFHIQSPKYSKYYPTMECGWMFQVTGTENVMVACSKFEMKKRDRNGNCKDFLQIGDIKFCGKNGPTNITVNVKKLVEVKFASNKSAGGFSCTMTALFNNSNTLRQSAPSCTSLEFSCKPDECIPIWHDCDGITHCSNGLDEINCPPPCTSIEFRCKPGECIPIWYDCDRLIDCSNGLDELDCPPPCTSTEFTCKPGECIPTEWDCDGITDCSNGLDQFDCPKKWSDIRNACIKGNNNNDFPGMTIDECKEKCVNEESYSCQSIEYNPRYKGCYLSAAMSSSSDFNVPCYVRGWLYMEILKDPCETDKDWSDIRNACIRGNNNQDFKGVSIDVCKEKCFNEDSFNCQSIEYRSRDQWCFLGEATSKSSDYYVPCYVDGWIYTERLREGCVIAVCDPECLNNGRCVGPDECRCQKGWKGNNCETFTCEHECLNNGACTGPDICDCQTGWNGDRCETAVCEHKCLNNGTCIAPNICDCPKGWKGDQCETVCVNCGCQTGRMGPKVGCPLDKRCQWNWGCQRTRPLVLVKDDTMDPYKILYPEKKGNIHTYSVSPGTEVMISCTGNGNTLNHISLEEDDQEIPNHITASCNNGVLEYYYDDDDDDDDMEHSQDFVMEDMDCKKKISAVIEEEPSDTYKLICSEKLQRIVYRISGSVVIPLITVCFDKQVMTTYWTQHIIHGYGLLHRESYLTRPEFRTSGLYKGLTAANLKEFYRDVLDERFAEDIRGFKQEDTANILRFGDYDFAKGHMAPAGDFVTWAEQDATFYYINAQPQYQIINNGNWKKIEEGARAYAKTEKRDLIITTGGFKIMNIDGLNSWLGSYDGFGVLPVPAAYWKVVYDPSAKAGFVFIVASNPFDNNFLNLYNQIGSFCTSSHCQYYTYSYWHKVEAGNHDKGRTLCCSITNFLNILKAYGIGGIPRDLFTTDLNKII